MNNVYVVGHKNPDADSVCSAIAYANFKRLQGVSNCRAVTLGKVNAETKFALEYFNVEVPEIITSVRTQIKDIEYAMPNCIYEDVTIKNALDIMDDKYTLLPVIDKNKKLIGILTSSDIMKYNIRQFKSDSFINTDTKFKSILLTLNAKVVGDKNKYNLEEVIEGKVVICTSGTNCDFDERSVVIVSEGVDLNCIFRNNPKCIIVENNVEVNEIPNDYNGIVMTTPFSIFNIIRIINLAVPVKNVMRVENFLCFRDNEYLESIKETITSVRFRHFPILDEEDKVIGILSRRHLINNKKKKVILVDHNEKSQSVEGLDQATVLEVIDHHRIGDVQTSSPAFFRNEPVGSTSTIVATMYIENNYEIQPAIAGLLLSAILSDTLLFKSPTCTLVDTQIAETLAKIAKVDLYEYGKTLLYNGADMKDKTVEMLIMEDFKEFTYNKYKFAISQVKVIELKQIEDIKEQLVKYITDLNDNRGYDMIVLMITDILNNGSEILYVGELGHVVKDVFGVRSSKGSTGYIPNITSRKTQVAPQIINGLAQL